MSNKSRSKFGDGKLTSRLGFSSTPRIPRSPIPTNYVVRRNSMPYNTKERKLSQYQ